MLARKQETLPGSQQQQQQCSDTGCSDGCCVTTDMHYSVPFQRDVLKRGFEHESTNFCVGLEREKERELGNICRVGDLCFTLTIMVSVVTTK